jgi:hypothetical protein
MIKKTVTFENLDGEMVTEDWWFNISRGDLVELSVGNELADRIRAISQANKAGTVDARSIIPAFKGILAMSVGKRVNNRFMRSAEITAEFMGTEAYSEVVFSLISNAGEAAKFVNNLVPADFMKQLEDVEAPKTYSVEDLVSMDEAEFDMVCGTDPKAWTKDQMLAAFQRRNRQAA